MNNLIHAYALDSRLDNIKKAKNFSSKILEIVNPGHSEAEASLALCWESLFNQFCESSPQDLSSLNTISSIIHKLTSSHTQIKSLEIKSRELQMKELDYQTKLHPHQHSNNLPKETLLDIEQQLNLL